MYSKAEVKGMDGIGGINVKQCYSGKVLLVSDAEEAALLMQQS